MNKQQRGIVSELLAIAHFIKQGYIVSKPLTDFNEYDLIIDCKGSLERIQVKTIYWDNSKNRYLISCVTSHIKGNGHRTNKKYQNNSFEKLCGVEEETGAIYLIPIKAVENRRSITIYPKGKPNTVFNRYPDFEEYRIM